ncbi:SNARE protein [Spironucleus salmonicida]|uniref:SNARE domain-containing protein n=1 Tax=Spironucleus salmonicida TaxID=348837 RepID=V6M2M4_9EUKA|nr:SNARE protein [Spironucleus salmonicida]|eukprot:EST47509.1 SNARE domain-containing protein [Spironucleus salmonicida]
MDYDKFKDTGSTQQLPAEVQQLINETSSELGKTSQAASNIEKQYIKVSKQNNPEQLKIFKENVTKQLQSLNSVNIVGINTKIQQISAFSKSKGGENKAKIDQQAQRLQVQADQKRTLISNLSQKFRQIPVQEQLDSGDAEMGLNNFKMGVIQQEAEEQVDQIKNIHQDMNQINQMMKQMSNQVYKGGETINLISDNVEEADKKVEKGVKNLITAKKTQKSKNKWLFIGLGVVAALVVILLLIFLI